MKRQERYHNVYQRGYEAAMADAARAAHQWLSDGGAIIALPHGGFALRDRERTNITQTEVLHPAAFDLCRRRA